MRGRSHISWAWYRLGCGVGARGQGLTVTTHWALPPGYTRPPLSRKGVQVLPAEPSDHEYRARSWKGEPRTDCSVDPGKVEGGGGAAEVIAERLAVRVDERRGAQEALAAQRRARRIREGWSRTRARNSGTSPRRWRCCWRTYARRSGWRCSSSQRPGYSRPRPGRDAPRPSDSRRIGRSRSRPRSGPSPPGTQTRTVEVVSMARLPGPASTSAPRIAAGCTAKKHPVEVGTRFWA